MTIERQPDRMTMGELADFAREVGIDSVAHLSQPELIEAIVQQRETNVLLRREGETPESSSKRSTESSLPGGWENSR